MFPSLRVQSSPSLTKTIRLWGINLAQATVYFRTYKNDRPFLKWLVSLCLPTE